MPYTANPALLNIHSLTANYFLWQGLRLVPMGAVLILVALRWSAWWPLSGAWSDGAFVSFCLLALFVSSALGRYYKRTFGQVRALDGQHARRDTIKWFLVYPALLVAFLVDVYLQPQILVSGIAWAIAILGYWHSTGRGRGHYVWASALLMLIGLAPAAGLAPSGRASMSLFFGLLGLIYVVGGVLDHRELRRLLPPLPSESPLR